MPAFAGKVTCGDGYTNAATIENVWESAGGSFALSNTDGDAIVQLQAGPVNQGQWGSEAYVPAGSSAPIYPGTTGIRFRNAVAGVSAVVISCSIAGKLEPALTIAAGPGAVQTAVTGDISVATYGALGQSSASDTTGFARAIEAAQSSGAGKIICPYVAGGYHLTGRTFDVPSNFTIQGTGGTYIPIYTDWNGPLFRSLGNGGNRAAYVNFENLLFWQTTRRRPGSIAIDMHYTDVCNLTNVRWNQFETGLALDNSTGVHLYTTNEFDNGTGVLIGSGSGGYAEFGCTHDSSQLGVDINGSLNGFSFYGCQWDTDGSGLNGASSIAALRITGGAGSGSFYGCNFFAEAVPTLGATCYVDAAARIQFLGADWNGKASSAAASPAAVYFTANATDCQVFGGNTVNHATASFLNDALGSKVSVLFVNMQEATKFGGAAPNAISYLGALSAGSGGLGIALDSLDRAAFYGASPVGQQATAPAATDLASVITLANALKSALTNVGLTN